MMEERRTLEEPPLSIRLHELEVKTNREARQHLEELEELAEVLREVDDFPTVKVKIETFQRTGSGPLHPYTVVVIIEGCEDNAYNGRHLFMDIDNKRRLLIEDLVCRWQTLRDGPWKGGVFDT